MRGGQRSKSAKIKLVQGNRGHDAVRDLEKKASKEIIPEMVRDVPDPPRKLKAEARREWDRVAGYLSKSKVLAYQELSILATYCNLHAVIVKCETRGDIPTGSVLTQYRLLAENFGLTPTSRHKVSAIDDEETENGIESFINRKRKKTS